MAFGLRGILAIIIPSAVGMVILAHPLIDLVLAHARRDLRRGRRRRRRALAMFALGLPGFCTFLYMVRVLQAMQDTRTAFRLYLVENAINIVLRRSLLVGPARGAGAGPLGLDRLHGGGGPRPRGGPLPGRWARRGRPHHPGHAGCSPPRR